MSGKPRAESGRIRQYVDDLMRSKNISRGDGGKVSKQEFIYLWSVIANETHCSPATARSHVRAYINGAPAKPLGRPSSKNKKSANPGAQNQIGE